MTARPVVKRPPTSTDPHTVLHRLAATGTWTRKRCLRTLCRALDVLVEDGWARTNEKRRYRITGAGFEALENET